MRIRVFPAISSAPTPLAAFDRALQQGNVHDTNLLALSSVVPVGASVERSKADANEFTIGDRLYCVMAKECVVEIGSEAWAGLGWATTANSKGGLFVESHGTSEAEVRADLESTLQTLIADRPYMDVAEVDYEVVGKKCTDEPICALVMAIFQAEPWM